MYIILSRNNCHLISPFFLSGPRKFTDESKKKKNFLPVKEMKKAL